VLWVIAILSNWTVVHRILYTRAVMQGRKGVINPDPQRGVP
jgi:hypothetical protein